MGTGERVAILRPGAAKWQPGGKMPFGCNWAHHAREQMVRQLSLLPSSTPQRRPERADIKKHTLRSALRGTLNQHKAIFFVPTDPVPIGISDDTAATDLVGHPQAHAAGF